MKMDTTVQKGSHVSIKLKDGTGTAWSMKEDCSHVWLLCGPDF